MSDASAERGRILIDLFTTLDGVMQAPGGVDEDREGGFRYGGWQVPLDDDVIGDEIWAGMQGLDALLLGRKTYDIFAGYWPHHANNPIGELLNRVPKYLVSSGAPAAEWAETTVLEPTPAGFDALRDRHRNIHVIGSGKLVRTLLEYGTFDELKLWMYPVVLGEGKRVFDSGTPPRNLRLIAPATTSPRGIVTLRYAPAEGEVRSGTMD